MIDVTSMLVTCESLLVVIRGQKCIEPVLPNHPTHRHGCNSHSTLHCRQLQISKPVFFLIPNLTKIDRNSKRCSVVGGRITRKAQYPRDIWKK